MDTQTREYALMAHDALCKENKVKMGELIPLSQGPSGRKVQAWPACHGVVYDGKRYDNYREKYIQHKDVMTWMHQQCHGAMSCEENTDAKVSFSWYVTTKPRYDIGKRWLKFLLSQRNPWREVMQKNPPIRLKKGVQINTLKYILEHGFIFYNLDIPANVLLGFCIATRSCVHWPGLIDTWDHLVSKGVDPALAYYLSGMFRKLENMRGKKLRYVPVDHDHWPMDYSEARMSYLARLCKATPDKGYLNQSYSECQDYENVTYMWNPRRWENKGTDDSYWGFMEGTYLNEIDKTRTESTFGAIAEYIEITLEQLTDIALIEQRRLQLWRMPRLYLFRGL